MVPNQDTAEPSPTSLLNVLQAPLGTSFLLYPFITHSSTRDHLEIRRENKSCCLDLITPPTLELSTCVSRRWIFREKWQNESLCYRESHTFASSYNATSLMPEKLGACA